MRIDEIVNSHNIQSADRIAYHDNGNIEIAAWFNDKGEYHREDGPALMAFDNSGKLEYEAWFRNDEYHREDGFAVIRNGIGKYYFDGAKMKDEKQLKHFINLRQEAYDRIKKEYNL